MQNAKKWVHPTKFTGEWPNWNGYTFLDWNKDAKVYHPGEDYNLGFGNDDLGQDTVATSAGVVVHTSKRNVGYGNIVIVKHTLGYLLRKFIKENYGIEVNELYSLYAHLKDIFVNVGDVVETGQRIGTVGMSGTKWAHLHFEIYAPIGELAEEGWRFYPVGWSKEKIKKYWLPAYSFIESTKNQETYDSFLGKPKEYWLTVEKDRDDLIKQLSQKDIDWAKKLEIAETENEQSLEESAKKLVECEKSSQSDKKQVVKLVKKVENLEKELKTVKSENLQLLEGHSETLRFTSALRLVLLTIANIFKGGE